MDKDDYEKDRTVFKNCYIEKERKNNINTLIQNQLNTSNQNKKIKNVTKNNDTRTLIIGFSNCGETYLIEYILLEKKNDFL